MDVYDDECENQVSALTTPKELKHAQGFMFAGKSKTPAGTKSNNPVKPDFSPNDGYLDPRLLVAGSAKGIKTPNKSTFSAPLMD